MIAFRFDRPPSKEGLRHTPDLLMAVNYVNELCKDQIVSEHSLIWKFAGVIRLEISRGTRTRLQRFVQVSKVISSSLGSPTVEPHSGPARTHTWTLSPTRLISLVYEPTGVSIGMIDSELA